MLQENVNSCVMLACLALNAFLSSTKLYGSFLRWDCKTGFPALKYLLVKSINISVINDLATDQRVHRMVESLVGEGYAVRLTGRRLGDSLPWWICR